ncbi:MAG: hypothetical protein ACFB3T_12085 [Geminicoccaceae bacterium]
MIEPDTPLAEIAWALDQSGIPVDLQRGDEIVPFERLQILLLTDEKDRDFVVQVMFVDDLVDNMPLTAEVLGEDLDDELLDEEDDDDAVILLFSTILPYRAKPSSAGDLARLLMVVNRLLPIGAFGYIERDQGLYLAYPLTLLSRDALEGRVLEGVINRLIFAIESYNGLIEAVATGSKTADDVFAEIEEMGMPLPPLGEPHVMKQRRH